MTYTEPHSNRVSVDSNTRMPRSRRDKNGPPPLSPGDAEAAMVMDCWKRGSEALMAQRRDYWLNLAFFLGEQWIWWDRRRAQVQQLPQAWSPLGPGRAKVTINRIESNMQSLMGRLLKAELGFEVPPSDSSDDVIEGARTAEKVLEVYHRDQDWEGVRHDEVLAAFLGGTSAVALEWDPTAGETIEYDDQLSKVIGTGDIELCALNITEFCVEPQVRDARQSRWWCRGVVLPPKVVKDHFNLSWMPDSDASALLSPLQHKLMSESGDSTGKDLCLQVTYYERPMNGSKGRYICVVNGRTLHSSDWPFPFKRLNFQTFRQKKIPSRWEGWTMLNSARSVQFAYNHARSVLAEHMKLAGNARLMAPQGSFVEEDFTDDPASILFYTPDVAGGLPSYLSPPNLPGWLVTEADRIRAELDDIMYVHATSRGESVLDRASGQALALLAEKDDTPLGPMAMEQQRGWAELSRMVLETLAKKATDTRKATLRIAPGIGEPVTWSGRRLRGQTQVEVPLENVMPHSAAARQAFAKDLWDRQIITDPRKYARMVGLPPDEFEELLDPDAARANRENYRLMMGEVEFPEDFDDHATHIAEHNRLRKSDVYKYAKPEIRKLVDDHIAYHEQKAHQELALQMQRASVNPALPATPQAAEPAGSMVPPTAAEQMVAQQQAASVGGQAPGAGGMQMPPGGAPPAGVMAGAVQ